MKIFLSGILLFGGFLAMSGAKPLKGQTSPITNSQVEEKLFYTYYGKKIPLVLEQDILAITFKPQVKIRSSSPLHLRLQLDLRRSIGETSSKLEIKPLGKRHALMKVPSKSRRYTTQIQRALRKKSYVQTTLPVLTRNKFSRSIKGKPSEKIILPNEIILNFEEQVSEKQKQTVLQQYNLDVIRPLRFSSNRYLVKSLSTSGTGVLDVANKLYQVNGIKSATPNFTLSHDFKKSTNLKTPIGRRLTPFFNEATLDNPSFSNPLMIRRKASAWPIAGKIPGMGVDKFPKVTPSGKIDIIKSPRKVKTPFQTNLLPLQSHLNSAPFNYCLNRFPSFIRKCLSDRLFNNSELLQPSIDIRAIPAWSKSRAGKGVVVAVLDDFIQWNHPDLIKNIYQVDKSADKLRGEKHGWDFANNDPDTRISFRELSIFAPIFQDSFLLSDDQLLEKYAENPFLQELFSFQQDLIRGVTRRQIAQALREHIRKEVSHLFHGTWVSGIIAAHPQDKKGVVGVAPNSKILPVKISKTVYNPNSGFETMYQISQIVEGIGYAIARGADIINMSYGSYLPTAEETDTIIQAQRKNPDLVFIGAVGNEGVGRIAFPAAIRGVIGVGAVSFNGNRAPYSNFGNKLVLVAPGGDVSTRSIGVNGGILTTGGMWIDELWEGISQRNIL